jgi:hypothetical protein
MPAAPHAGACRTKSCILTTNYEPKSRSRRTGDQFDEKIVIVRGAHNNKQPECEAVHTQDPKTGVSWYQVAPRASLSGRLVRLPRSAGLFRSHVPVREKPPARLCLGAKGGWSAGIGSHPKGSRKGDPARLWADRAAEIWQAPINSMSLLESIEAPRGAGGAPVKTFPCSL